MVEQHTGRTPGRRKIAAGVGLSVLLHGAAFWLLSHTPPAPTRQEAAPVELEVIATPAPEPAPPVPPAAAPAAPEPAPARARPARRAPEKPGPAGTPTETSPAAPAPSTAESHPLMKMREPGGALLMPSEGTLARALGPVEAPPAPEKPRRKPRLPGTGLTTLPFEPDQKVRLIHPRFYEVLAGSERHCRPDSERIADEVRGDLSASASLKRWLFGSATGDLEAMKNQVPTLACLVCVTLRPNQAPEIELAGASGSRWFDRAATESLERASVRARPDEDFDPARACYRFAAKVWRTRPDLTNLSIPFKLNFQSAVHLVEYKKLGG